MSNETKSADCNSPLHSSDSEERRAKKFIRDENVKRCAAASIGDVSETSSAKKVKTSFGASEHDVTADVFDSSSAMNMQKSRGASEHDVTVSSTAIKFSTSTYAVDMAKEFVMKVEPMGIFLVATDTNETDAHSRAKTEAERFEKKQSII